MKRAILSLLVLCSPAMAAESDHNLLENGGFEIAGSDKTQPPAGWRFYTSKLGVPAMATNEIKQGGVSFRLRAQGVSGGACGIVQTVAVTAGDKYTFSAWIRKNEDDPLKGTAYGQLVIEWQDADAKEISRSWGKKWGPNTGHAKREEADIKKVEAPAKSVQAIFGVHLYDGKSGGKGSVLVDEVSVTTP